MICIKFQTDTQSILMYHSVLKVSKNLGPKFFNIKISNSICFICFHIIAICFQEISWVQKLKVSCHDLSRLVYNIFCF